MSEHTQFTAGAAPDTEMRLMFDHVVATGEIIPFLRPVAFPSDGAAGSAGADLTLASLPYVPVGNVSATVTRAPVGAGVNVTVGDAPLAATPPTGVFIGSAEIHVWGCDVVYTVEGTDPDPATFKGRRVSNGGSIYLQNSAELTNFKVRNLVAGTAGSVFVTYYNARREEDRVDQLAT